MPTQPDRQRTGESRGSRRSSRRWGSLRGGAGVGIVAGSAALGAAATIAMRAQPGRVLGACIVVGVVIAALAVRPRSGRLIFPVPILSYLIAAFIAGIAYNRSTSKTELIIGAAQWVANGFILMALATALAIVLVTARWLLRRRNRRPSAADWSGSADGTSRGPRAGRARGARGDGSPREREDPGGLGVRPPGPTELRVMGDRRDGQFPPTGARGDRGYGQSPPRGGTVEQGNRQSPPRGARGEQGNGQSPGDRGGLGGFVPARENTSPGPDQRNGAYPGQRPAHRYGQYPGPRSAPYPEQPSGQGHGQYPGPRNGTYPDQPPGPRHAQRPGHRNETYPDQRNGQSPDQRDGTYPDQGYRP